MPDLIPNIRVLFYVRASRNLYGYAHGPFIYIEEFGCFVFNGKPLSLEQWQSEGEKLTERWAKYRPAVRVLVEPVAPVVLAVASEAPVEEPAPAKRIRKAAPVAETPSAE